LQKKYTKKEKDYSLYVEIAELSKQLRTVAAKYEETERQRKVTERNLLELQEKYRQLERSYEKVLNSAAAKYEAIERQRKEAEKHLLELQDTYQKVGGNKRKE
jgi:seryl-tRNA synthetase